MFVLATSLTVSNKSFYKRDVPNSIVPPFAELLIEGGWYTFGGMTSSKLFWGLVENIPVVYFTLRAEYVEEAQASYI